MVLIGWEGCAGCTVCVAAGPENKFGGFCSCAVGVQGAWECDW